MKLIATYETYLFAASFVVSLINIHILWRKHREINLFWLLSALIAIAIYNLFSLLDASSTTLEARILWSKLLYFGAAFITPFMLIFFINYPHKRLRLDWRIVSMVLFIPVALLVMVLTNDLHHLVWESFIPIPGVRNGFTFVHGPLYWIGVGYDYLCGMAVVILISEDMHRSSGIYRTQSRWLLASSIFPFVSSLIYDLGMTPLPGFEILPIGFSISGLGLAFCIVFLKMFEIIPVSRSLLVENLQDGLIVLDNQMRVVDINPAAQRLLEDYEPLNIGSEFSTLVQALSPALPHESLPSASISVATARRNLLFIPSALMDDSGKPAGSMYVIRDMTEIRAVEKALQQSQSRYQSLIEDVLDISTVGICILDKDFRVVWVNQASVNDWLGSRSGLLGKDFRQILKDVPSAEIVNGGRLIGEMLLSYHSGYFMEDVEIHFDFQGKQAEKFLQYASRPVSVGYFKGGRIEQFIDITEQKFLQNKIELLAITDELTGIYNRRGLMEFGRHDFNRARRMGTNLGVIYFDIDNFKELNDQYGHAQGDTMLVETIRRVESCLRDMDTFARYGGDEFVIIVPEAELQQCVEIAKRIHQIATTSPVHISEQEVQVNISLGISQIRPTDSLSSLLNRADLAMYRAKNTGRGHIETEE
ncbi:MAG: hypothetical protein PWQ55_1811 [Chloroflexota bacterium]|nr:hypothetical protein [Chloroflexota bacterium]